MTSFSQAKRVGVGRVYSSVTEAVFIQVGGGRVSLSNTCCSEFYFVETTFIFWNKSSCCCSDNPAFSLVCKLPFLKTFELVTLGACPGEEFICLLTTETRKGQFKKELQKK